MLTRLKRVALISARVTLISTLLITLPIILIAKLYNRHNRDADNQKYIFGFDPLINNKYWAEMLKEQGLNADSVVMGTHSINTNKDFDHVIQTFRDATFYLFYCLVKYDVFFISFNGGIVSIMGFQNLEPYIFKFLKIKVVILAYGSDVSAYDLLDKPSYLHVLNSFYPQSYSNNVTVKNNLKRWQRHADFVVSAMFFNQGLYRNDLLTPNSLNFPVEHIRPVVRSDERRPICIVHSPNHRIIKGTEYIIEAVERLKNEIDINFILLEKKSNAEVLSILRDQADIFIEKLVGPSYALSAIEAMAYGVPVIGSVDNGDWDDLAKTFRRYSFLADCPIVSASVESLEDEIKRLCVSSEKRRELSLRSREYVMRYHSYRAGQVTFGEIIKYINGERGGLKNFYHPVIGEFENHLPKIHHPLVNSRIVD